MRGKSLFIDGEKFSVRGVTYGPFRADETGSEYHTPQRVAEDFAQMREHGINTVRLYTVPPRWLLDLAHEHSLLMLVGLPWEQHVTFLDDRSRAADIERRVREGVRACAGHAALLGFAVGNEIPASIVRWYGPKRVERFIERLCVAAKREDPQALVTYVNYPSTEYLDLPMLDFVCFNVFLESEVTLDQYLARLQNIAADKPLVVAELGLDSRRHGEDAQAELLARQVPVAFANGCAGAFIFSWTDEWHRGGFDIDDWQFGLTTKQRTPKPALESLRRAFDELPFPPAVDWPRISVVICTFNGSRTIRETLDALRLVDYPEFEIIVVDDGSTDGTADILKHYDARVIRTSNSGLSNARNTGMLAAHGEIVAFLDDDAAPDPQWLSFLAWTFLTSDFVGVGGPNIAPGDDGFIADCIGRAPGGPIHVLLSDRVAEHIPGCNMAFRREALLAIGGFDPRFRIAGDDVDICWRLQQNGWTIGFHPAAVVWHHRRNSIRAYWKQQLNYGRAEGMLERKWPSKYNALGHPSWGGRVYGGTTLLRWGWRIYHGTWGSAAFQSVYQTTRRTLLMIPATPEWYLIVMMLAGLSVASLVWPALWLAAPILILAAAIPVIESASCAITAWSRERSLSHWQRSKRRAVTALLYLMQPAARLLGRIRSGLTPWRSRAPAGMAFPWPRNFATWSENWRDATDRLARIERLLQAENVAVLRGGDFDAWDLEICGGLVGRARLRLAIEEHGSGKQLVRCRVWPVCATGKLLTLASLFAVSGLALLGPQWTGCLLLGVAALGGLLIVLQEVAIAMGAAVHVLGEERKP